MKISAAMAKAIDFEAKWRGGRPVNVSEDADGKIWLDHAQTGDPFHRCLSAEPQMQAMVALSGGAR